MITAPLWAFSSCSDNTQTGTTTETVDNRILDRSTDSLNVSCTDADSPAKRSSTGTVYVNVNTGDMENVEPTKFTDFKIGYIGYLSGIGKSVNMYNATTGTPRLTVYPVSFYEIKLSDLLVCGIITIEDAIILGPLNKTSKQLNESFNKLTAKITNDALLLDKFRIRNESNRINKDSVRKLLLQVKTRQWEKEFLVCRDAWQLSSKGKNLLRTQSGRYNTNKECPPGEYFLNWSAGTFYVYPAHYAGGVVFTDANGIDVNPIRNIDQYPGINNNDINRRRQGIAFHNGTANAAIGCITFNVAWNKATKTILAGHNAEFHKFIYPKSTNASYLNFLFIEERNAIKLEDDISSKIVKNHNYWRWYDLIKPSNN